MATHVIRFGEERDDFGRFAQPSRELVEQDELFALWSVARAEANIAYDAWREAPGRETYLAYRAAEDRADAAQDALAGQSPLAA